MSENGDAAQTLSRHLHDAIARVRRDVEKVEFWAEAIAGFSQPVPSYDSSEVKLWMPAEQAKTMAASRSNSSRSAKKNNRKNADKRGGRR